MDISGDLSVTYKGKVATISFSHPSANSFPSGQLQKLTEAFDRLSSNTDISIILLKSDGDGAFCSGASFDELLDVSDLSEGLRFFSGFANVINAMRKCSKIIVGRIHGKAVGGGVGLAAACDYAMATETASIKLSELAIGIGPFVIAPAVERKLGLHGLTEMTLNPQHWKSAHWAKDHGLYAAVYADQKLLDEALISFCERLATYNPEALANVKEVLWRDTDHWETLLIERAAISGKLVLSDYTKSALAQYKN